MPLRDVSKTLLVCLVLAAAICLLPACLGDDDEPAPPTTGEPTPLTCQPAGCSSQLCVDATTAGDIFTTCDYKPEHACLALTECGTNGAGGACGWDQNSEYLDCVAQAKCGKPGYPIVDLAELESHMAAWDGQQVTICEAVELGPMMCTKMGCSTVNPCCNTCAAGFRFDPLVSVDGGADQPWGCTGDDCSQTCSPISEAGLPHGSCLYGTFEQSPWGNYGTLHVDGWIEGCVD